MPIPDIGLENKGKAHVRSDSPVNAPREFWVDFGSFLIVFGRVLIHF